MDAPWEGRPRGSRGLLSRAQRLLGLPVCLEAFLDYSIKLAVGWRVEATEGWPLAPWLAAVHFVCREMVLLGTLSFTFEKHIQRL